MKKIIATVTAGLVLSGVTGVGLSAVLAAPAGAATPSAATGSRAAGHHPLRAWLREHRRAVARDTVRISAQAIGITPQALRSALRSGQSIAQVSAAHGVDVQAVVNALAQAGDARVGRALDSPTLTQAQGDKIEAALPHVVAKAVDHVPGGHAG